jgi:hypothetical protein
MYHVELREFPHNTHAYNLDAPRLQTEIVGHWVRGEIFNFAERDWIPQRTELKILEGPELPLNQMGLGRGWTNAEKRGKDVTAQVLGAARATLSASADASARSPELEHDILERLALGPVSLAGVWRLAQSTAPDATPGDRLATAERALNQLLRDDFVELCRGGEPRAAAIRGDARARVLRSATEWSGDDSTAAFVRLVPGAIIDDDG